MPMPRRSSLATGNNDGHESSVSPKPIFWTAPDNRNLCWTVTDGKPRNDQTISVASCDDSPAQQFVYTTGATRITVANTNYCVEFGPGLGVSGRPLRLQECRKNGAPGQQLFITDDHHIALERGPGQCADVRNGEGPLQSWRCISDNTNQIFGFEEPPPPPPPVPELAPGQLRLTSDPSLNLCLEATQLEDGYLISGMRRGYMRLAGDTTFYVNIAFQLSSRITTGRSPQYLDVLEYLTGFFSFERNEEGEPWATCIDADGDVPGDVVTSQICDSDKPSQQFEYGGQPPPPPELALGQLRLASARSLNLCLEATQLEDGYLTLAECVAGGTTLQTFSFATGRNYVLLAGGTTYYVNIPFGTGSRIVTGRSPQYLDVLEYLTGFFSFERNEEGEIYAACIEADGALPGDVVTSQICNSENPFQQFEYGGQPSRSESGAEGSGVLN
ncbi:hypothetical protein NCC49_003723 [Naganishia albida]|nr:hypothetical protein NCC49_003723 [Naganishia albida]